MDYTAENLEKAVTLFYRTEAGQQAEAHQWLTEAQNSPQAWGFVWELLSPHRVVHFIPYVTHCLINCYSLGIRGPVFCRHNASH